MNKKEIPIIPGRKSALPIVYGDTPSFLGCTVIRPDAIEQGFDVIFAGVP